MPNSDPSEFPILELPTIDPGDLLQADVNFVDSRQPAIDQIQDMVKCRHIDGSKPR